MILPNCFHQQCANYQDQYFGFDDIKKYDKFTENQLQQVEKLLHTTKQQFLEYPDKITYKFNSRGFRDDEWPNELESLKQCNFCIGDSNVIGVGLPREHTYINIVNQYSKNKFINCGKSSAYNYHWNLLNSLEIIKVINPKYLIIHWSPFYKTSWGRTAFRDLFFGNRKDMNKFIECIDQIELYKGNTQVIHVFNPLYHDFYNFFNRIDTNINHVIFEKKDLARDGVHYGKLTHADLAEKICKKLS